MKSFFAVIDVRYSLRGDSETTQEKCHLYGSGTTAEASGVFDRAV